MKKKENKFTLIPDIKVMHFKPDEDNRLPEMKRVVEDGPRYRGKTVPELKKMAKVLGLKVGGKDRYCRRSKLRFSPLRWEQRSRRCWAPIY